MTLFEADGSMLPEYYKEMYLDGYKPHEILQAVHQKILNQDKETKPEDLVIRIEEKRK